MDDTLKPDLKQFNNSAEYDSFVEAYYLNYNEKYGVFVGVEEYPGRKMSPLNVDIVIQIQGINESKRSSLSHYNLSISKLT